MTSDPRFCPSADAPSSPFTPAATSAFRPVSPSLTTYNTGRETFVYLMIGERIADDEVTYHTDAT